MWPSGQSTRPPYAVERDALSGRGSRPPTKELFVITPMHMMNRDCYYRPEM